MIITPQSCCTKSSKAKEERLVLVLNNLLKDCEWSEFVSYFTYEQISYWEFPWLFQLACITKSSTARVRSRICKRWKSVQVADFGLVKTTWHSIGIYLLQPGRQLNTWKSSERQYIREHGAFIHILLSFAYLIVYHFRFGWWSGRAWFVQMKL